MTLKKRIFRIFGLSLSICGGLYGGAIGSKIDFTDKLDWRFAYVAFIIAGAVIGFCVIWFIYCFVNWFITHLFEDTTEIKQIKNTEVD